MRREFLQTWMFASCAHAPFSLSSQRTETKQKLGLILVGREQEFQQQPENTKHNLNSEKETIVATDAIELSTANCRTSHMSHFFSNTKWHLHNKITDVMRFRTTLTCTECRWNTVLCLDEDEQIAPTCFFFFTKHRITNVHNLYYTVYLVYSLNY